MPVRPNQMSNGCLIKLLGSTLLVISFSALAVTEHAEIIKRSDWPGYENGANILALPQVSNTLSHFSEDDKVSVEIRYPGGTVGRQWADSMARWLITLGIPNRHISLFAGSGAADQLLIVLIDKR